VRLVPVLLLFLSGSSRKKQLDRDVIMISIKLAIMYEITYWKGEGNDGKRIT
jgi:hypothetical protein